MTKTNLNNNDEIYSSMKKSIREMKGSLTTAKSDVLSVTENKTFYGENSRSRSKSKFRNQSRSWERHYNYSRSSSRDFRHFLKKVTVT